MFSNEPASSSTTSLSLDDLGWLAASALIDLPTLPSPRASLVYSGSSSSQRTAQSSTSSFQSALEEQRYSNTTQPRHATLALETTTSSPPPLDLSSSHSLTPATPVKSRRFSPSTPHLPSPPPTPPHYVSPSSSPSPRCSPARTEWIYRQPRTPPPSQIHRPGANSSPCRSRSRPHTGYHSPPALTRSSSNSSIRSTGTTPNSKRSARSHSHRSSPSNTVPPPFWSTILRPRSRSERSIPLLKSIPSQSQIDFTPAPSTIISAALSSSSSSSDPFKVNSIDIRPPSVASTLSTTSLSTATSSSRPETPTSPTLIPSSSYGSAARPRYQRRRATDPGYDRTLAPLSTSCPPSKSILTRASSISTKNSSSTAASKSVKFVDMPTVHYAGTGYWDLHMSSNADIAPQANMTMGVDVDNMDVDVDSQLSESLERQCPYGYSAEDRELQCTTPTPERERTKGLRRLVTISKKASSVPPSPYSRPAISGPYALGTLPSSPPTSLLASTSRSTTSLKSQSSKYIAGPKNSANNAATGIPLRVAPSLESFRSVKSTGGRSVRSLGSVKSNSNTHGFRAWLNRLVAGRRST